MEIDGSVSYGNCTSDEWTTNEVTFDLSPIDERIQSVVSQGNRLSTYVAEVYVAGGVEVDSDGKAKAHGEAGYETENGSVSAKGEVDSEGNGSVKIEGKYSW